MCVHVFVYIPYQQLIVTARTSQEDVSKKFRTERNDVPQFRHVLTVTVLAFPRHLNTKWPEMYHSFDFGTDDMFDENV